MVRLLAAMLQTTDQSERIVLVDLKNADPFVVFGIMIIVALFILGLMYIFAKTLLRSQELPKHNSLVSALALLTFIALAAAIAINAPALETIAATGVGAIAGAVSNVFIRDKYDNTPPPDSEPFEELDQEPILDEDIPEREIDDV